MKNSHDRDHSVFPEVQTPEGELLSPEFVEFAYSRAGRQEVGKEFPNPVPLEPPLGYVLSKPLHEQIRDLVMNELSQQARAAGMETLEESEDFDVGDDYDPMSPWEMEYEPTQPWFTSIEVEAAEARAAAARKAAEPPPPPPAAPPSDDPPPPPEAPKAS